MKNETISINDFFRDYISFGWLAESLKMNRNWVWLLFFKKRHLKYATIRGKEFNRKNAMFCWVEKKSLQDYVKEGGVDILSL